MKIAIVSLFTSAHEPLNRITEPAKRAYAERWGYTFINYSGTLDADRPPAWSKIRMIQRHLNDYDWVYWIDADAAIMNPEIRLETFLRDYDLIIAQERYPSHFGNRQFNTGSFFVRNTQWSQRLLETLYGHAKFKDHLYWEQAALRHALDTDPEAPKHVYIETDQTRFNSFVTNYSKGDFVLHAVNFSTSVDLKEKLLCEAMDSDSRIADEREPDVPVYFLINRLNNEHELLLEFGLPSLMHNSAYSSGCRMTLLETTPSELHVGKYGMSFSSLRERMVRTANEIKHSRDQVVAFAQPAIQFLRPDWKRRCLIRLGAKDGLFLENGSNRRLLGDAFYVVRANARVRAFFSDAAGFMEGDPYSRTSTPVESFAALTEHVRPQAYGCDFDLFPRPEVDNTDSPPKGLDWIAEIVVHSTECAPALEAKRQALKHVRDANVNLIESLRGLRTRAEGQS
jgi:hypothetical protein